MEEKKKSEGASALNTAAGVTGAMVGQGAITGAAMSLAGGGGEITEDDLKKFRKDVRRVRAILKDKSVYKIKPTDTPADDMDVVTGKVKTIIPSGLPMQQKYVPPKKAFEGLRPNNMVVANPKTVGTLAHEMSHSVSIGKNKTMKALYSASKTGANPLASVYSAYKGSKGEELSPTEKAVVLAASAPVLAEETKANANALRALIALRKKGIIKGSELAKNLGALGVSQLSYMLLAGVPIAANAIARFARESE